MFESWCEAAADRFIAAGVKPVAAKELARTIIAAIEGGFVSARVARDETVMRTIGRQMRTLVETILCAVHS